MRRLLHHCVLFAAGCTTAWLCSWLQDEPVPMMSASGPGVMCPPSAPGDERTELRELREQVEGLTRALVAAREATATAAARAPAPQALPTAPPSSLPEATSSAAPPEAPVEAPVVEEPAEDPAARERLAQLEQAAQAQADREAAERAAVLAITRVHQQLSSGNLDGVSAILEQAAASLTGPAAQELRAATRSLENEDLATARQHLELALISAR